MKQTKNLFKVLLMVVMCFTLVLPSTIKAEAAVVPPYISMSNVRFSVYKDVNGNAKSISYSLTAKKGNIPSGKTSGLELYISTNGGNFRRSVSSQDGHITETFSSTYSIRPSLEKIQFKCKAYYIENGVKVYSRYSPTYTVNLFWKQDGLKYDVKVSGFKLTTDYLNTKYWIWES